MKSLISSWSFIGPAGNYRNLILTGTHFHTLVCLVCFIWLAWIWSLSSRFQLLPSDQIFDFSANYLSKSFFVALSACTWNYFRINTKVEVLYLYKYNKILDWTLWWSSPFGQFNCWNSLFYILKFSMPEVPSNSIAYCWFCLFYCLSFSFPNAHYPAVIHVDNHISKINHLQNNIIMSINQEVNIKSLN